MTNEELLAKARDGCKLSEAMLYEQTKRLIYKIANKIYKLDNREEIEDLYSIGNIGWTKGYQTYDLNNKAKFSTYVCRCVKIEIMNHFYKINLQKRDNRKTNYVYLDGVIDIGHQGQSLLQEESIKIPNGYGDFDKLLNETITNQEIDKAVKTLLELNKITKNNYDIFIDHLVNETTGAEIGKRLSISRQRVNQIVKKTGQEIKKELNKNNYDFNLLSC